VLPQRRRQLPRTNVVCMAAKEKAEIIFAPFQEVTPGPLKYHVFKLLTVSDNPRERLVPVCTKCSAQTFELMP
jgi:hypothetical protein